MKVTQPQLIVIISIIAILLSASSCATIQLNQANRAEQVIVTFDKTIK